MIEVGALIEFTGDALHWHHSAGADRSSKRGAREGWSLPPRVNQRAKE
jgi:hypothetical protein